MPVDIIISNSGNQPIYEQIVAQVKSQIISGALAEGYALPSMRLLAKELRISVITTKRAYEELERQGFIVSLTGKGSYVAGMDSELVKEEELRRVEELLQKAAEIAKNSNIGLEEMKGILTLLYKGE